MKKCVLTFALVAVIAAPAMASIMSPAPGQMQAYVDAQQGDPRAVRAYDNWTPTGGNGWIGTYNNGASLLGDDLHLTTPGLLDTMGFSVVNAGAAGTLTGGSGAIYFYTPAGVPIYDTVTGLYNGFGFNLPTLALANGGASRISFAAGALASQGFVLPQDLWVVTQWSTAVFTGAGTVANLGVEIRGPITTGSSTDLLWDATAGTTFNFGGSPLANIAYFVDVPEPMTIVLLGFGALALLRRR